MDQRPPCLPSINTMLQGVPRASGYSTGAPAPDNRTSRPRVPVGHRRHASEHISSSSSRNRSLSLRGLETSIPPALITTRSLGIQPATSPLTPSGNGSSSPPPAPPTIYVERAKTENGSLRPHMPSMSLPPPPQLMQPKFRSSAAPSTASLPLDMQSLSISSCTATPSTLPRRRTHSRSFSDFTHSSSPTTTSGWQGSSPPLPGLSQPSPQSYHGNSGDAHPLLSDSDMGPGNSPSSGSRYSCPYCRKGFSRPSSLRTHTYSHTGEKPFICTVEGCHRRFSVHSNLRRHLRIHRVTRTPASVPAFTVGHGFCMSS